MKTARLLLVDDDQDISATALGAHSHRAHGTRVYCRDAGTRELVPDVLVPGRILIVDDEPLVCGLLRDFLATVVNVATAASGAEALQVVPVFQPDVILTDMMMPGMSGADLLNTLRRAGVMVPVILMSGKPITMPEGFFGLLEKPFDLRKLAQVVAAALDHGRTERAARSRVESEG
jgi:DNA-binding NtrC family response regulator